MIGSFTSVLIVLSISLAVWGLLDIANALYKNPDTKTRWVFVILFLPIVGPLYYFRVIKKARMDNEMFNAHFDRSQL